ncbi:amidase signature domain-containing protein [Xylariomycetidae sp. FL2044]|nr:amidase signature domain-containing protein [Xylariomycetidae sp. FL2044]
MRSLFLLSLLSCTALAALVDDGKVVDLDGVPYYVGGVSVGRLGTNSSGRTTLPDLDIFPLTIVDLPGNATQGSELLDAAARYASDDDVFQNAFLKTIYLRTPELAIDASSLAGQLSDLGTSLVLTPNEVPGSYGDAPIAMESISEDLPQGPYFVSANTGNIFKAYRLYSDDNLAFIQGVVSDESDGFMSLPAVTASAMTKSIAVPSRLYYTVTDDQPLAGLRFGVKDLFHVKGVGTSGGSRAYYELYGVQNTTAPAIQRLLDLGAVLVGKTGMTQFANGDKATSDWVDFHSPFNPRGDGYQDPSGSSTGSGAAMGSYPWLDFAVGSDTGGSMRGPAGLSGVFGGRPSTGAITMNGTIPLSPVSDTAGIFARSPSLWARTTQAWYPDLRSNYTSYPRAIQRSAFTSEKITTEVGAAARTMIDAWVAELEGFLGATATFVNYTARWAETHGAAPANLAEMMNTTYGAYIAHDQWRMLGEPFFADYAAAHGGRQPFVNPNPLSRWQWGQAHATDEVYAQALRNISLFTGWWETEGFGRHDPESCSESLYLFAWSVGAPSYRNAYFAAPTGPPLGFGETLVSIMTGVPELVVPIGEVTYQSTITMQDEYMPVAMALRMARGCDYVLASLVRDLEEAGVLRPVATGSRLFPEEV